jgi:hypothetical protein
VTFPSEIYLHELTIPWRLEGVEKCFFEASLMGYCSFCLFYLDGIFDSLYTYDFLDVPEAPVHHKSISAEKMMPTRLEANYTKIRDPKKLKKNGLGVPTKLKETASDWSTRPNQICSVGPQMLGPSSKCLLQTSIDLTESSLSDFADVTDTAA